MIGFSGAYYTSQSTSPDNAFSAGSVDLQLAVAGQVVDGAGLAPGTRLRQSDGDQHPHRAEVTLTARGWRPTTRWRTVVTCGRQTRPSAAGTRSGPASWSITRTCPSGQFALGRGATFEIELAWPADVNPPALEGAETSFKFEWLASRCRDRSQSTEGSRHTAGVGAILSTVALVAALLVAGLLLVCRACSG